MGSAPADADPERRFHALLVEGTSGVGKSSLIHALIRRHVASAASRKIRSFVHLAQTHTYGPLAPGEDRGTLTAAENRVHLDRIVALLEYLHAAHIVSPIPSFAIIDTLHLTHCVRPGVIDWDGVAAVDARLAAIGCKLAVLSAKPETLRTRSIEARAGSQFLTEYARKFGSNDSEILDYFIGEQTRIADLAGRSSMDTLHLRAEDDADRSVDAAFAFWRASPSYM